MEEIVGEDEAEDSNPEKKKYEILDKYVRS